MTTDTLSYDDYIALINSHIFSPIVRLELVRSDNSVYDSIKRYCLPNSSVTVDCSSNGCRRSLNLVLDNSDEYFLPDPVNGGLWMNMRANVYSGIEDKDGNEKTFLVGQFVCINSQPEVINSPTEGNIVNLKMDDKFMLLQKNELGGIIKIQSGDSITKKIKEFLIHCGDTATPLIEPLNDIAPNNIYWNVTDNYGTILKDLANMNGREMYYDRGGHLVFKTFDTVENLEEVWNFKRDGIDATYTGVSRVLNFNDVYNRVVVQATNSETNSIYQGVAENNDLSNATNISKIGSFTKTITNDKLYNNEMCQTQANVELNKRKRVQESINLKCVPLPHILEANRAITISDDKVGLYYSRYAIQKIQMDLSLQSEMNITALKFNDGSDFDDRFSSSYSIQDDSNG